MTSFKTNAVIFYRLFFPLKIKQSCWCKLWNIIWVDWNECEFLWGVYDYVLQILKPFWNSLYWWLTEIPNKTPELPWIYFYKRNNISWKVAVTLIYKQGKAESVIVFMTFNHFSKESLRLSLELPRIPSVYLAFLRKQLRFYLSKVHIFSWLGTCLLFDSLSWYLRATEPVR